MPTGARKTTTAAGTQDPPVDEDPTPTPAMSTPASAHRDTEDQPETYAPAEDEHVSFEGPGVAVIVGEPPEPPAEKPFKSTCVVDEGKDTVHVGNAVPGTKVCSYHTMHYHNDGTRREGLHSNTSGRSTAKAKGE